MTDEQPNVQAEEKENENDPNSLTPQEIKALEDLNKEIGKREDAGDYQWFIDHTALEFAFLRGSKKFASRSTFLDNIAPKAEKAGGRDTTDIKVIPTPYNKKRAVVSCLVTTDQGTFHNLRLFVRSDVDKEWQILGWANEQVAPPPPKAT